MASTFYDRFSVSVQPEIEGYLDKKETSVLRSKTSRRWCWVQGSVFYQQKAPANNGPGEIEVLDMSGINCVRKVSSDTAEAQFEIIVKKSQIFICTSRQECTAWIKALQKAMTMKGSGHHDIGQINTTFYASLQDNQNNIYQDIVDNNSAKTSEIPHKLSKKTEDVTQTSSTNYQADSNPVQRHENEKNNALVYSTPFDAVKNEDEGLYSDIVDCENDSSPNAAPVNNGKGFENTMKKSPVIVPKSRSIKPNKTHADQSDMPQTQIGNLSFSGKDDNTEVVNGSLYAQGISTVGDEKNLTKNVEKSDTSSPISSPLRPHRKAPLPPNVKANKSSCLHDSKDSGLSKVQVESGAKKLLPVNDSCSASQEMNLTNPDVEKTNELNTGYSEDILMKIFDSMNLNMQDIPDLGYRVSAEDTKPLKVLKSYLRENDAICCVPRNRLSHNETSITSCKNYLAKMEDMLK